MMEEGLVSSRGDFVKQKNTSELHALRNYTTMLLLQIALHASLYGYMVCSMHGILPV